MRASFAEEKTETSIAVTANTNEFVEKVCKMEAGWFCFCFWNGQSIQLWLLYYNQAIISFRQAVFLGNHSLFVNYFPKWNIETTYFDINI
jgi:O-succinylhomoserine sulfhydrylase